ncbi:MULTISPECIES: YtxH domain-containing protein [Bacillus]|uniref:YtxH domain-containing protein n=1 Tax=Bacillus TaxID=1386 RepID=UPI000BB7EBC1|nr:MULTISPECIES: YtxH domain-containing protein [Bacillus]
MNTKSFLYGVLIGGVIASVSTLLSTPQNGKQARTNVKRTKDHLQQSFHEIKGEGINVKDQVNKAILVGKSVVTDVSEDLKTSLYTWQNEIEPNKEKIEKNIVEIQDEIEKLEKSLQTK